MARTTPRPEATHQQRLWTLHTECPCCDHRMGFAYEDRRKVTTLEEVLEVRLQVRRCVNPACERYSVAYRPEAEGGLALPPHEFGLDMIAWIGEQRYRHHRSMPEIHRQLQEEQGVVIAERTVEHLLARYDEQRITVHAIETGARNMLIFQLVMRWLNSSKSLPARRKCKKLIFATC